MDIHIVQPGDTIYTISDYYGVSPERLSIENDIEDPDNLVIGEALVIIRPVQTYIVQEGDSLESIARAQGVDTMELLRNNPNVSGRELYIGETLVIRYEGRRTGTIKTNGFIYPFIDKDILRKTLPYLTYLTIYSYEVTQTGSLVDIDDTEIIQIAKSYKVVPIMFITAPIEESGVDKRIAHTLISDIQVQNTFINSILDVLRSKGYLGININTPFIEPQDKQPYVELIGKIRKRLNSEGFTVTVTIAPSTFEVSTGLIYGGVDYTGLSQTADNVLYLLTYAWRFQSNLPISTLPFNAILQTLRNAMRLIPPEKCMLGISNVGYLWEFPYFSAIINANFLNYNSARRLASDTGSVIQFNEPSHSSFFQYVDRGHEYMAWFKDARSLYPWIAYSQEYRLQGVAIWNITYFVAYLWLLINAEYVIEKIL
ncbi:MAG TPA: LysM peptidoglycan-binding domain-containing protein [Clostridiales bacterium]|nr:LysM peptidoglycan-binding domain-containing protein [Clostridiales bacterium]